MLTTSFIFNVADSNSRLSEFVALEHIELDPGPAAREVPFLDRQPLVMNSDRTLEQLNVAAGNPYHYGMAEDGGFYEYPLVFDQNITVRTAIASMRDRLTLAMSFLQEVDVSMNRSREPGNPRHIAVGLLHDAASFFAVIEIAAIEEHGRQLKNSIEAG
ncbi:hypothetical protein ACQ86G_14170 [Roseateles chitinivorans]|uniref:hypothetical protein n=1 Tax=Roseateles chitinivorans TaxID=2917965 RepID=UPI003D66C329